MLYKAWNSKGEMPYCFPRSSMKFQGHTGQNITDFDPNWAFLDYRPVAAFKSLRFALLKETPDCEYIYNRPISQIDALVSYGSGAFWDLWIRSIELCSMVRNDKSANVGALIWNKQQAICPINDKQKDWYKSIYTWPSQMTHILMA